MNTAMTTLGGMSDDTITFTGSVFSEDTLIGAAQPVDMDGIFGGAGTDYITFDTESDYSIDLTMNNDPNRYKYSEDRILQELKEYISGTYNAHYSAGDDKIQTLDLIEAFVVMVNLSVVVTS